MNSLIGRKVRIHRYVMRDTNSTQNSRYEGTFGVFVAISQRTSGAVTEPVAVILTDDGLLNVVKLDLVQFVDTEGLF